VPGQCNRLGCNKPMYKSVYGLGYLAGMCEEHYWECTPEERFNADRFRYAE